jgi:surfactin synthase thioesterase subunit
MGRLLICFPFAGGGTIFFRTWQRMLAGHFEVEPVLLPGRERRLLDPPCLSIEAAADDALSRLRGKVEAASSVTVFGHSLGAVLAYAFVLRLAVETGIQASRLIASGSHPPHKPRPRNATGLGDDAFLAKVSEFAGFNDPAMLDPEMREVLLPTLRADVEMHESYLPEPRRTASPITVVRGRDDTLISAEDLLAWQDVAENPIELITVPGGHMYPAEQPEPLFELLKHYAD